MGTSGSYDTFITVSKQVAIYILELTNVGRTVCFLDMWPRTKCKVTSVTSVSDTVVHALSCGSLSFAVHGSFFNHYFIGLNS